MAKGASLTDPAVGGFLDDLDATVLAASTGTYTYPSGTSVNALIIKFVTSDGEEHTEAYSSGAAAPTDDGTGFATTPKDNSKAKRFILAMVALGYPGIEADVTVFNGAKLHLKREALPKMPGIDKEGDKDKTVLLPVKLLALPGKSSVAVPGAGRTTAASNGSGDLDAATIDAIQNCLGEAPGNSLKRVQLATKVMLKLTGNANMTACKKLAGDAAFLAAQAEAGGWQFANDTVSLS